MTRLLVYLSEGFRREHRFRSSSQELPTPIVADPRPDGFQNLGPDRFGPGSSHCAPHQCWIQLRVLQVPLRDWSLRLVCFFFVVFLCVSWD